MIYKSLYIIGNGFDLHHDIPCGFPSFMEWVKVHDAGLFYKLNKVYNNDAWKENWWSDFENSLAQLDISYYANNRGNMYDPEYIKDGSIDEKNEYASNKVAEEFAVIEDSLRTDLQKWLVEKYAECNNDKRIQIQRENSIFLSFNYTKTLEEIYGVDPKQIYHIHGLIDDKNSLIFGHGLGLVELNDILERQKTRVLGEVRNKKFNLITRLQMVTPRHKELATISALESIYSLKKDIEGCIENNIQFFDDILDVQGIYVYGFSFSPIDMPYLEKIVSRTSPETHWVISWYSQEDKRRIMDFVMKCDIRNITIINGIKKIST